MSLKRELLQEVIINICYKSLLMRAVNWSLAKTEKGAQNIAFSTPLPIISHCRAQSSLTVYLKSGVPIPAMRGSAAFGVLEAEGEIAHEVHPKGYID